MTDKNTNIDNIIKLINQYSDQDVLEILAQIISIRNINVRIDNNNLEFYIYNEIDDITHFVDFEIENIDLLFKKK